MVRVMVRVIVRVNAYWSFHGVRISCNNKIVRERVNVINIQVGAIMQMVTYILSIDYT